jgi:hypothetical protein
MERPSTFPIETFTTGRDSALRQSLNFLSTCNARVLPNSWKPLVPRTTSIANILVPMFVIGKENLIFERKIVLEMSGWLQSAVEMYFLTFGQLFFHTLPGKHHRGPTQIH